MGRVSSVKVWMLLECGANGIYSGYGWAHREDLSHLPGLELQTAATLGLVVYHTPPQGRLSPLCLEPEWSHSPG